MRDDDVDSRQGLESASPHLKPSAFVLRMTGIFKGKLGLDCVHHLLQAGEGMIGVFTRPPADRLAADFKVVGPDSVILRIPAESGPRFRNNPATYSG